MLSKFIKNILYKKILTNKKNINNLASPFQIKELIIIYEQSKWKEKEEEKKKRKMSCIPNIYNTNVLGKSDCTLYTATGSGIVTTTFSPGRYLIELWGANGGKTTTEGTFIGGSGGYVSGILSINYALTAYFCIGIIHIANLLK